MAPTSALFLLTLALLQLSSCFAQDHSYQGSFLRPRSPPPLVAICRVWICARVRDFGAGAASREGGGGGIILGVSEGLCRERRTCSLSKPCLMDHYPCACAYNHIGASVADQTKTALLDWKDHLASQGSIFSNDSRFHSWTNDGSMCRDWVGIYCNLAGDLDILIAIGEDLRGTLPAQLSVATGLTGILLKENSFHGAPPRLLSEAAGYATCLAATLPPRGLPQLL